MALDLVDLDGAGRDDGHGGQPGGGLGRHGAEAGAQRAARARAADGRDGARRGGAPGAGGGAAGPLGQEELLEQHERSDGEHGGQGPVGLRELLLEGRAALAAANVAADRRADAAQALGPLAELLADLRAGQAARLGRLGQRHARPDQQRLDRRDRRLHRLGDLLVAQRVDLAQQERGALGLGQRLDVGDELAELLAVVDLVGGRRAVLGEVDVHGVHADRRLLAQVVQAAVARDAVQPRPHVDRAVVGEHRVEGGGEDLLQHVLGVLAGAEHVPAEREQAGLVAADERLVGRLVAAPGQGDQALVALQAQERRGTAQGAGPGVLEG
nr:hypothetical protein [Baekduia soli]